MIDPSQFLTPQPGMTSIEAAQAFLAAEDQDNAVSQATRDAAGVFDMDALARSGLARWVGFDFDMTVHANRIVLTDTTTGLKTTCLYTQPMDEKTGKRIFRALVRLKNLHEAQE